jgi:hypothetical protein
VEVNEPSFFHQRYCGRRIAHGRDHNACAIALAQSEMCAHVVADDMRRNVHRQRTDLAFRMSIVKTRDSLGDARELRLEFLDIPTVVACQRADDACLARFRGEFHAAAQEHRGGHCGQCQSIANFLW